MTWLRIAALTLLFVGPATQLHAQDSTAAPLSSTKEDKEGDESGAIRSLEGASEGKTSHDKVTVPSLGTAGPSRTGGAPPGTPTGGAR